MPDVRRPTDDFVRATEDSRRWNDFRHRPDDIFISTPPKSGTTWMQGIVLSLLWPSGEVPEPRHGKSPWVDARFRPIGDVLADLEAQDHRRFIKTHSPADCVPTFEDCRYLAVYRDGRDALMSWANHRSNMRPELITHLNAISEADGARPIPPTWDGDMDEMFDQWEHDCSPIRHLSSWWPRRSEPYVSLVHYNDLLADLEGEMRRIASFLSIDVPEAMWSSVVERCRLDQMRESARSNQTYEMIFRTVRTASSTRARTTGGAVCSPTINSLATTGSSPTTCPTTPRRGSSTDLSSSVAAVTDRCAQTVAWTGSSETSIE